MSLTKILRYRVVKTPGGEVEFYWSSALPTLAFSDASAIDSTKTANEGSFTIYQSLVNVNTTPFPVVAEQAVDVDTSGGNITINLPPIVKDGILFFVQKSNSANTLTLSPDGSDTVNLLSSTNLNSLETCLLISDNTTKNWVICNHSPISSPFYNPMLHSTPSQPSLYYAEDSTTTNNTSTTYYQKLRLTFTAVAGDYLINYSGEVSASNNATSVFTRVELDDTTTLGEHNWAPDTTTNLGFGPIAGFKKVTLTAGSHDIDFDFAASTPGGNTVSMKNVRLCAMHLS